MDFQIALLLGQDGLTNGAIYALLALALVLVFAVTRVIFIPQGEFVAYGALTLAGGRSVRLEGIRLALEGESAGRTRTEAARPETSTQVTPGRCLRPPSGTRGPDPEVRVGCRDGDPDEDKRT